MMVLVGQSEDAMHRIALGVARREHRLTFLILLAAPAIVERIGARARRIVAKVMGLISGDRRSVHHQRVTTVLRDILRPGAA